MVKRWKVLVAAQVGNSDGQTMEGVSSSTGREQ